MTIETYKTAKLAIFEKAVDGLITESQRDELLMLLEEKKAESDLTAENIKDFFDNLKENYPNLEEDIEKLAKKIEKSTDDNDDTESSDTDEEDSEVSEAAIELMGLIDSM